MSGLAAPRIRISWLVWMVSLLTCGIGCMRRHVGYEVQGAWCAIDGAFEINSVPPGRLLSQDCSSILFAFGRTCLPGPRALAGQLVFWPRAKELVVVTIDRLDVSDDVDEALEPVQKSTGPLTAYLVPDRVQYVGFIVPHELGAEHARISLKGVTETSHGIRREFQCTATLRRSGNWYVVPPFVADG